MEKFILRQIKKFIEHMTDFAEKMERLQDPSYVDGYLKGLDDIKNIIDEMGEAFMETPSGKKE